MSLKDVSMKEIMDNYDLLLFESDIFYICEDVKLVREYINLYKNNTFKGELEAFFSRNEDKIDKEKLILCVIGNNRNRIKRIEEDIKRIQKMNAGIISKDKKIQCFQQIKELEVEKKECQFNLNLLIKLANKIDTVLPRYEYSEQQKRFSVRIIDVKDRKLEERKKRKKFKKIDEEIRQDEDEDENETEGYEDLGIEVVLQSLSLSDYTEIFSNEQIGEMVRKAVLDNVILKKKIKTVNQLKGIDDEEYREITKGFKVRDLVQEEKKMLEDNIEYVDMDKLLIISAYRFEEGLEHNIINVGLEDTVRRILVHILNNIENKEKFKLRIQAANGAEEVEYSIESIKNAIKRIYKDKFISTEYLEGIRNDVFSNVKTLEDVNNEYIDSIFSKQELEELSLLNDENFIYVSEKLQWKNEKIMEALKIKGKCSNDILKYLVKEGKISNKDILNLYFSNIINLEQIKELKLDLSNLLDEEHLYQYHHNKDNLNEELGREYLDIYKLMFEDKIDEKESHAENLMAEMIENYDDKTEEEYINDIKFFFKEGILTLDSIIGWNDEEIIKKIISQLYYENAISWNELKQAIKQRNISFDIIKEIVWKENATYEQRMQIMLSGLVPEEEILELYKKSLIRKSDLYTLAENSVIKIEKVKRAIWETSIKEIEKNSDIAIDVRGLEKIKGDASIYHESTKCTKNDKRIIDPNIRKEYFALFGACKPKRVIVNKESPFYGYEFYIIPSPSESIGDSIVIAEKIYDEKEQIDIEGGRKRILNFATNNATYIVKYSDLLVLSNYTNKEDILNSKNNMIFRATHTMANDEKNGRWAASVIYAIAKSILSSNLEEYNEENKRKIIIEALHKICTDEQINEILDFGIKIDTGEYNCEIIDVEGNNSADIEK